jgi:hypothetical protein
MNPVELIISKLSGARKVGSGWMARCPCHNDSRPSLSVSTGSDGKVLLRCHVGCGTAEIVAALGLEMSDLFPPKNGLSLSRNGKPSTNGKIFPTADEAVAALERQLGPRSAMWTYHNAEGEPVGVVIRWDKAGGKEIRPVARHADGWRIGAMAEPRPLHNLPALANAKCVVVVEGERCVDAARSLGFVATTSAGGSQAAAKTDWGPLAGKEVWILPDNDAPGRKYADTVEDILAKLNPAPVVRIIELPGLPDKGDIVDWIEAKGKDTKPEELQAEIETLAKAATVSTPTKTPEPGPVLKCMADVAPRPVSWLWPGRIPLGRITLLVGRPGEGKSFMTIDAAARVSTGTPWPDGSECPKGSVILISAEDDPADTIRPRLDSHYADVHRVHLLSAVRRIDDKGAFERMITLADVDAIEMALASMSDCKLIVVDPIGSFLGGQTDAHRDNAVRAVLAPIAALAEKYGPAVLAVAHRRKSLGSIADDLALGSRAFTGIARAVWHLTRDEDNKTRRMLLPGKNNLAAEGGGLAFSIIGDPPHIAWERDPVNMTADDALAVENQGQKQKPGPDTDALNKATDWLQSTLASGPRLAKEIFDEWTNGQGGSRRTLYRAKESLHVEAYRPEVPGPWWWRLQPDDAKIANKTAKPTELGDLGNLGNLAKNTGDSADFGAGEAKVAKIAKSQELGDLGGLGLAAETPAADGPSALFDTDTPADPPQESLFDRHRWQMLPD